MEIPRPKLITARMALSRSRASTGAELSEEAGTDHMRQQDVFRRPAAHHHDHLLQSQGPFSSFQEAAGAELVQLDTAAAISKPRTRRVSEHGCGCCGLAASDVSSVLEARVHLQALSYAPEEVAVDAPAYPSYLMQGHAGDSGRAAALPAAAAAPTRFISPFAGFAGLHCLDGQGQQQLGQQLEPEQEKEQELEQELGLAQQEHQQPSLKHGSASLSDAVASCQLLDVDGTVIPVFAVVSISKSLPAV